MMNRIGKNLRKAVWISLLLSTEGLRAQSPELYSYAKNGETLRKFMGVTNEFFNHPNLSKLKLAILDRGFEGVSESEKHLPNNVELFSFDDADSVPMLEKYSVGRRLGQIVQVLTSDYNNLDTGVRMRLYNANYFFENREDPDEYYIDPSNFAKSVDDAIEWKANVILCNVNFDVFGDFDGKGGINAYIKKARKAGIIWIQSAGELRGRTYDVPFDGRDVFVELKSWAKDTRATITLNWTANSADTEALGTNKNLRLDIYASMKMAKEEKHRQKRADRKQVIGEPQDSTETALPFEAMRARLDPGNPVVKISAVSGNFSGDRIRLTVMPDRPPFYEESEKRLVDPVEIVNPTPERSMPVGADSDDAITVGSWSPWSSIGKTADGRLKPNIILDNPIVEFSDRQKLGGSQVAAAKIAAMALLIQAVLGDEKLSFGEFRFWCALNSLLYGQQSEYEPLEDIMKRYKQEGLGFGDAMNNVLKVYSETPEPYSKLMKILSEDMVAAGADRTVPNEFTPLFGIKKNPSELEIFQTLPSEVLENARDYKFWIYFERTGRETLTRVTAEKIRSTYADFPWRRRNASPGDYSRIIEIPGFNNSPTKTHSLRWSMPSEGARNRHFK